MKGRALWWSILLWGVGVVLAGEPVEDGFAALVRLSEDVKNALERYEGSFSEAIGLAVEQDRPLPPEAQEVMEKMRPWLASLGAIAAAPVWAHPPLEEISPTSDWVDTTGVLQFYPVVRAEAHARLREGDPEGAMDLVLDMTRVGQRYATSGTIPQALVGIAGAEMLRDVQTKALWAYPPEKREALHARLLELYATHPSHRAMLEGERNLLRNGIDVVFQDDELKRIPPEIKQTLIAEFRRQGVEEALLRAIEEDRMLSPRQWRESMEKEVDRVLDLLFEVEDLSIREIEARYKKAHEKWHDGEGEDGNMKDPVETFLQAIDQEEPGWTAEELLALHEEAGKQLTRLYVQRIMPHASAIHKHIRFHLAMERLLRIESAQWLYSQRHGHPPDRLQALIGTEGVTREMTLDPLSGERFRRLPKRSFRVYTVGLDGEDGGGKKRDRREGDFWLKPETVKEGRD